MSNWTGPNKKLMMAEEQMQHEKSGPKANLNSKQQEKYVDRLTDRLLHMVMRSRPFIFATMIIGLLFFIINMFVMQNTPVRGARLRTIHSPNYTLSTMHSPNAALFPFHIFQIGFHKCATRTLTTFFERNGITSVHWEYSTGNKIRETMIKKYSQNKSMLYNDTFTFYADFAPDFAFDDPFLSGHSLYLWKILLEEYKNSKFILNIRNINHWLRSRYRHWWDERNCFFIDCFKNIYYPQMTSGVDTEYFILENWRKSWYEHHCNVIQYFQQNSALNNLLIFDVENDPIQKLTQFFEGFNVSLNGTYWRSTHEGTTYKMESQTRWKQFTNKYPQFLLNNDSNNETECWRIINSCASNAKFNPLLYHVLCGLVS